MLTVCVEASQCASYFIVILKVFEDHAARRFIKKMDVNCCNEGCNWVGNLGSLLEVMMNLLKIKRSGILCLQLG